MQARGHHATEKGWRRHPGLAELLEHDLRDPDDGVEAHEVQECERAHRMAAAELHAAVDVGGGREAGFPCARGVEQVGDEQPVHDEPRAVLAAIGSLPSRRPKVMAASKVEADVATARTTSTSGISGTGLKKWRPTNRSGLLVDAAMSPIERLEVLEAKIVSGRQTESRARHSSFLSSRLSVTASMTRSQSAGRTGGS